MSYDSVCSVGPRLTDRPYDDGDIDVSSGVRTTEDVDDICR